nr:Glutamate--tRNA ligase [Ipomoea batatas]
MESPTESCEDALYRIPSSVFAPDTPTNRAEWSIASTESLFSIQIGSFTRDEFLWTELGSPGADSVHSPANNPIPNEVITDGNGDEIGKHEAWEGVVRENEDQINQKSNAGVHISHNSADSMASEISFAFPILTGHGDKDGPDCIGCGLSQEQRAMSETQPIQEKEPLKSSESENQQAEAQPAQTTWFSWFFSCCASVLRK